MQFSTLKRGVFFAYRFIYRLFSPSFHSNSKKWKSLKGKYKGKRVFLIGNGPSLNKTPLYLLRNEYTLCFNRFDLMTERFCWWPSFFAMSDSTVCEDIKDIIVKTIENTQYSFFVSDYKGSGMEKVLPPKDNILYFFHEFHKFSKHLPFTRGGYTVAIEGLQILNYLGFDEIILIGVDMNYVIHKTAVALRSQGGSDIIQSTADDDPNHFDPRYFGKGAKYCQPNEVIMYKMLTALQEISEWFKNCTSTKVINAGYDSKVESFEKIDFIEKLGYTEEKIDSLFEDVVQKHGFASIDDLKVRAVKYNEGSDINDSLSVFCLPTEEGASMVKKYILNFIPIGPYNGKLYFIKRH